MLRIVRYLPHSGSESIFSISLAAACHHCPSTAEVSSPDPAQPSLHIQTPVFELDVRTQWVANVLTNTKHHCIIISFAATQHTAHESRSRNAQPLRVLNLSHVTQVCERPHALHRTGSGQWTPRSFVRRARGQVLRSVIGTSLGSDWSADRPLIRLGRRFVRPLRGGGGGVCDRTARPAQFENRAWLLFFLNPAFSLLVGVRKMRAVRLSAWYDSGKLTLS